MERCRATWKAVAVVGNFVRWAAGGGGAATKIERASARQVATTCLASVRYEIARGGPSTAGSRVSLPRLSHPAFVVAVVRSEDGVAVGVGDVALSRLRRYFGLRCSILGCGLWVPTRGLWIK